MTSRWWPGFALCPVAAALAPSDPSGPLSRATDLVAFERGLGLYPEPVIHGWCASRPALLAIASFLYLWAHVPATVGALVWARLDIPAFPLARDASSPAGRRGRRLPARPRRRRGCFGGRSTAAGWTGSRARTPRCRAATSRSRAASRGSSARCAVALGARDGRDVSGARDRDRDRDGQPLLARCGRRGGAAASGLALAVIARTRPGAAANRRPLSPRSDDEHVGPDSSAPRRRSHSASPS